MFLLADHILWLGRADVCSVNTERWSQISNKFWLFSISMNLVRDFYEISQLGLKCKVVPQNELNNVKNMADTLIKVTKLVENNEIFMDTVKNSCDLFIPLTALGYVKLSPGTVGLLGTISSLVGIWVLINPKLKLSPS